MEIACEHRDGTQPREQPYPLAQEPFRMPHPPLEQSRLNLPCTQQEAT